MESSLPAELLAATNAPVALIGLNATGSHSTLWRAFTQGGGNRSLRWLLIDDPGNDLPKSPKGRRTSYEWFIPKGILKTNWMSKHLNSVPAVAVVFIDLEWNASEWNERKMECAARVQAVRAALSGRGTKIALVLIQRQEMTPPSVASSEESTASERATALCSACDLSARSLFVLPINAENLNGYISRLENAFYELAQNYYHQEIRGVKAHRDYLNKTTHLYLFVRHQFKAGFLNELKRDLHAGYKHYSQAYNLLMEVRATDTNIMEVKTVGGFINYKMCKLAFQLNLPRDAISQFRRHMDIFQHKVGLEELAFEHRGWQSSQCSTFAEIFADAIKHGLPAIQTQHPGLYYQQAAQYAVQRRKLAEELCNEALTYPEPDPLMTESVLEYFGQRPWRPGKVSIEPQDLELEQKGISALKYRERHLKPTHSEVIVAILRKAIEHYKIFKSPRAESNLTVTMAEELVSSQKCEEALQLLKPIVTQYRKDGWKILLKAALQLALKCAYLVASVSDYIAFGLELASNSTSDDLEEKSRIIGNISRLFESPPKIPSAEPGLTSKSERAAVGEAAKLWSNVIMGASPKALEITLGPEVYNLTALKAKVVFQEAAFKANQSISISCYISNDCSQKDEDDYHSIPLLGFEVYLKQSEGGKTAKTLKKEENILLGPKVRHVSKFDFLPSPEDVGKKLMVDKIVLRLGKGGLQVIIHQTVPVTESNETPLANFFPDLSRLSLKKVDIDDVDGSGEPSSSALDFDLIPLTATSAEIRQREPQMQLKVNTNEPALIGEWFHIRVQLINNELSNVKNVSLVASLEEANDPIIADTTRLTLDYKSREPETPVTPKDALGGEFPFASPPATKSITELEKGSETEVVFYIRSSTTGLRGVIVTVTYQVTEGQTEHKCSLTQKLNLDTVEPFLISSELLSCRNQQKMQTAYSDEPFLLLPEVKSLSMHALRIVDSAVELRYPMKRIGQTHPSQLKGCTLYKDSIGNECYAAKVSRADWASSSLEVQDLTLGKYVLKWLREDYAPRNDDDIDLDLCATSTYELQTVKVCQSSLYAEAVLPAYAVARVPFGVIFKFTNRTDIVLEFNLSMESSDAFMLSGNKQQHFRIPPESTYDLHYVLYPLVAGEAVALPTPKLSSLRPALPHDDVGATLQRLLPSTITVLPRSRGKYSPSLDKRKNLEKESASKEAFYVIGDPVFVPRVPFGKPSKSKVVC